MARPKSFAEWITGVNLDSAVRPKGSRNEHRRRSRSVVRVDVTTDDEREHDCVRVIYPRTSGQQPRRSRPRESSGSSHASSEPAATPQPEPPSAEEAPAEKEAPAAATATEPPAEEASATEPPKQVHFEDPAPPPPQPRKSALKKTKMTRTTTTETVVTESDTESSAGPSESESSAADVSESEQSTDEASSGPATSTGSSSAESSGDTTEETTSDDSSSAKRHKKYRKKRRIRKSSGIKKKAPVEEESDTDDGTSSADDFADPHPTCECRDCEKSRRKLGKKKKHRKAGSSDSEDEILTSASEDHHVPIHKSKRDRHGKKHRASHASKHHEEPESDKKHHKADKHKHKKHAHKTKHFEAKHPEANPGPHPRRPNYISPIRAEVIQTERVIESADDPPPNAYYDAKHNIVRVYHGPVWGSTNPNQPMYPRRDPSMPLPSTGVPSYPHYAGPSGPLAPMGNQPWTHPPMPTPPPPPPPPGMFPYGQEQGFPANRGAFAPDDGAPRDYKVSPTPQLTYGTMANNLQIGKQNPYYKPSKSMFADEPSPKTVPKPPSATGPPPNTTSGWDNASQHGSNKSTKSQDKNDNTADTAPGGGWGDAPAAPDAAAADTWGPPAADEPQKPPSKPPTVNGDTASTSKAMPGSWCDPTAAAATGGQVDAAGGW